MTHEQRLELERKRRRLGDNVVPDGGHVRVPVLMMDSTQRAVTADADDAYAAYCRRLGDAWQEEQAAAPVEPAQATPVADADAAYAAYCRSLGDAWQQPATLPGGAA